MGDVIDFLLAKPGEGFPISRNRYWIFHASVWHRKSEDDVSVGVTEHRHGYAFRRQRRHQYGRDLFERQLLRQDGLRRMLRKLLPKLQHHRASGLSQSP